MAVCYLFAIKIIRLLFGGNSKWKLSLLNRWLHLMWQTSSNPRPSAHIVYLSEHRLQSWGQILSIHPLRNWSCYRVIEYFDVTTETLKVEIYSLVKKWNARSGTLSVYVCLSVLRYQWRCPGIDAGDSEWVRCLIFCSRRYCNALNPWYWRWIDCFAWLYDTIYVTFSAVVAARFSIKWMNGTRERESNRM